MKILLTASIVITLISCKPTYTYEGQQRGSDPYHVTWITRNGEVATCFVIENATPTTTCSDQGIELHSYGFKPEGGMIVVSDATGTVKESPQIKDYIYFCSPRGYKKIKRNQDISDLIRDDYRVMDHKLIDHLVSKKLIP